MEYAVWDRIRERAGDMELYVEGLQSCLRHDDLVRARDEVIKVVCAAGEVLEQLRRELE